MTSSTTVQGHLTRAAGAGREAVSTALRGWGETAQVMLGLPNGSSDVPRPDRLVDACFDVADQALAVQREFAKALLGIGDPAIDAVGRLARRTVEAAERYTREASEDARPPASAAR